MFSEVIKCTSIRSPYSKQKKCCCVCKQSQNISIRLASPASCICIIQYKVRSCFTADLRSFFWYHNVTAYTVHVWQSQTNTRLTFHNIITILFLHVRATSLSNFAYAIHTSYKFSMLIHSTLQSIGPSI